MSVDSILAERYCSYNPDHDPSGFIGIRIADAVLKRCDYDFDEFRRYINSGFKKAKRGPNYAEFYRRGERLTGSFQDYSEDKRKLLEKYFPKRFGSRGKQPLNEMEDATAGALFDRMMKYSFKRLKREKQ